MPRELLRPVHGEDVSYMEQAVLPVCIITELSVSHESPQVSNRTSFHQPYPQGGSLLPTEPREQNVLLKTGVQVPSTRLVLEKLFCSHLTISGCPVNTNRREENRQAVV